MESSFSFLRRVAIPAIVFIAIPIPFLAILMIPLIFFPFNLIGLRAFPILSMLFTAFFIGLQFKLLHTWKRKELKEESTWYCRWSTGHLVALLVALFIFKEFMVILYSAYLFSHPDLLQNSQSYPGILWHYLFQLMIFSVPIGTLLAWFLWFDVPRKPSWLLFRVVLAYAVFQVIIGIQSYAISMRPTNVPDLEQREFYAQFPGTVLLELENSQVLFDYSQLHTLLPNTIYGVSLEAVFAWLLYILWSWYRNYRNNNNELVGEN